VVLFALRDPTCMFSRFSIEHRLVKDGQTDTDGHGSIAYTALTQRRAAKSASAVDTTVGRDRVHGRH